MWHSQIEDTVEMAISLHRKVLYGAMLNLGLCLEAIWSLWELNRGLFREPCHLSNAMEPFLNPASLSSGQFRLLVSRKGSHWKVLIFLTSLWEASYCSQHKRVFFGSSNSSKAASRLETDEHFFRGSMTKKYVCLNLIWDIMLCLDDSACIYTYQRLSNAKIHLYHEIFLFLCMLSTMPWISLPRYPILQVFVEFMRKWETEKVMYRILFFRGKRRRKKPIVSTSDHSLPQLVINNNLEYLDPFFNQRRNR